MGFATKLLPSLFSRLRPTQTDAVSPQKALAQKSARMPPIGTALHSPPMLAANTPGSSSTSPRIQHHRSDPQPTTASVRREARELRRSLSSQNPAAGSLPARSLDFVRFGADVLPSLQPTRVGRSEELACSDESPSWPGQGDGGGGHQLGRPLGDASPRKSPPQRVASLSFLDNGEQSKDRRRLSINTIRSSGPRQMGWVSLGNCRVRPKKKSMRVKEV